jgi:hypothetical protein
MGSWKDVKPVVVPHDKQQVQKIGKIKDAKDASSVRKMAARGAVPEEWLSDKDVTEYEMKHKSFKLNLMLG